MRVHLHSVEWLDYEHHPPHAAMAGGLGELLVLVATVRPYLAVVMGGRNSSHFCCPLN